MTKIPYVPFCRLFRYCSLYMEAISEGAPPHGSRNPPLVNGYCFFSSAGQFSTTVIGSGLASPAGTIIRNRSPSVETA